MHRDGHQWPALKRASGGRLESTCSGDDCHFLSVTPEETKQHISRVFRGPLYGAIRLRLFALRANIHFKKLSELNSPKAFYPRVSNLPVLMITTSQNLAQHLRIVCISASLNDLTNGLTLYYIYWALLV